VSGKWKTALINESFFVYMMANTRDASPGLFQLPPDARRVFIFAGGVYIQRNGPITRYLVDRFDRIFPWLLWLVIINLIWIFTTCSFFVPGHTKKTFWKFIFGIPMVFFNSTKIHMLYNALLDILSYKVFLAHFLVI
jgi:hypothetical protein